MKLLINPIQGEKGTGRDLLCYKRISRYNWYVV